MSTTGWPTPTAVVRSVSPGATSMSHDGTIVGDRGVGRRRRREDQREQQHESLVYEERASYQGRMSSSSSEAATETSAGTLRSRRNWSAAARTFAETGAPVRRRYSRYESPEVEEHPAEGALLAHLLGAPRHAGGQRIGNRAAPSRLRARALARTSSAAAASFTRASTRSVRLRASSLDSEVPGREVWLGMGTCRSTAGNASVPERGEGISKDSRRDID